MSNILNEVNDAQLNEIATNFRNRVAELQTINAADYPQDAGNEEVEVHNDMVAEFQTFANSPIDRALTEVEAQEVMTHVTEVTLLSLPSL